MQTLGVIPSRFASSRFPGKPLIKIGGISIIQRVYEQALKAKSLSKVLVATDDQRIFDHVQSFGGEVMMTHSNHRTGTDRCAEVALCFQDMEAILNIQGDEPFIDPEQIDSLVAYLKNNKEINIATLARKILDTKQLFNPNDVKVVFSNTKTALYFSRNPIPYLRDVEKDQWVLKNNYFKHLGIYAFRRNTLLELTKLPQSTLEKMESLEQLRWLENAYDIGIQITDKASLSVDSPTDIERIEKTILNQSSL
jgi:3-deoxy-manno-octulosonate cytidylyltransferase (CMP-KDO synthetase)